MTDLRELLANNIKNYRNASGLSQAKLAEKANTATNYIAAIEAARRFPSVEVLEKIALALGVDTPALFSLPPIQSDVLLMRKELEEHVWQNIGETLSNYISENLEALEKSAPGNREGNPKNSVGELPKKKGNRKAIRRRYKKIYKKKA